MNGKIHEKKSVWWCSMKLIEKKIKNNSDFGNCQHLKNNGDDTDIKKKRIVV